MPPYISHLPLPHIGQAQMLLRELAKVKDLVADLEELVWLDDESPYNIWGPKEVHLLDIATVRD